MTFLELYNSHFTAAQNVELCCRLIIAFIVGGIVGMERSQRFKEADIRTHILVCCTTALIMLISKYGFADLSLEGASDFLGTKGADSARVAAQAVSGISFLCAGVIFKVGSSIKGLTTAAGIWLTAGIGLAIGAGMYIPVFCTVLLIWMLQHLMYRTLLVSDSHGGNHLKFIVKTHSGFDAELRKQLDEWKAQVTQSRVTVKMDETTEYDLIIRRKEDLEFDAIREFVSKQGDNVLSVSMSSLYMQDS